MKLHHRCCTESCVFKVQWTSTRYTELWTGESTIVVMNTLLLWSTMTLMLKRPRLCCRSRGRIACLFKVYLYWTDPLSKSQTKTLHFLGPKCGADTMNDFQDMWATDRLLDRWLLQPICPVWVSIENFNPVLRILAFQISGNYNMVKDKTST